MLHRIRLQVLIITYKRRIAKPLVAARSRRPIRFEACEAIGAAGISLRYMIVSLFARLECRGDSAIRFTFHEAIREGLILLSLLLLVLILGFLLEEVDLGVL